MKRISLTLITVLLAAGACASPDTLTEMQLRRDGDGVVRVIRDGKAISVGSTIEIEPGDIIETAKGGRATFALEGGEDVRSAALQENTRVVVANSTKFEVERGHALVSVDDVTKTVFDEVTASASKSTYRIDRDFGSSRVGVYNGEVGLAATGQLPLDITQYFQATVAAGELPGGSIPYQLRLDDAWDQSVLKEQVALEGNLEQLGNGLQQQLGSEKPKLNYFSELVGGRSVAFMKSYLNRRPTDLLIGFLIARNANDDIESAFEDAFGYFDDGAKWSIASAIMDVKPRPILASLNSVIDGLNVIAAGGGQSGDEPAFSLAAAEAANTGQAPTGPGSEVAPPPSGGGGDEPGGGEDPKPNDPDEKPRECSSSAECTFQDIQDGLPGGEPSPTPTGIADVIDGDL